MKKLYLFLAIMLCASIVSAQPAYRVIDSDGDEMDITSDGNLNLGAFAGDITLENGGLIENGTNNIVGIDADGDGVNELTVDNAAGTVWIDANDDEAVDFTFDRGSFADIEVPAGLALRLDTGGTIILDPANGQFSFRDNGSDTMSWHMNNAADGVKIGIAETAGQRHLILTDDAHETQDHDHPLQANPTFFVHSVTAPNTANDEWVKLTHDQTNAIFGTGSGDIVLTGATAGVGGLVPKRETADPCLTMQPGSIFYNETAGELCYCNESRVDLRVKDASTACY